MTMRTSPQRRVTVAAISGSDREALHQIGYIPLCVVNCLGSLPSRTTQSPRQAGICDQFCHAIREGLGVTLGTMKPVMPLITVSRIPPESDATLGREQLIASTGTKP